jgi:hypothetical protein
LNFRLTQKPIQSKATDELQIDNDFARCFVCFRRLQFVNGNETRSSSSQNCQPIHVEGPIDIR